MYCPRFPLCRPDPAPPRGRSLPAPTSTERGGVAVPPPASCGGVLHAARIEQRQHPTHARRQGECATASPHTASPRPPPTSSRRRGGWFSTPPVAVQGLPFYACAPPHPARRRGGVLHAVPHRATATSAPPPPAVGEVFRPRLSTRGVFPRLTCTRPPRGSSLPAAPRPPWGRFSAPRRQPRGGLLPAAVDGGAAVACHKR